jgi:SAM-dependent methyltransferase
MSIADIKGEVPEGFNSPTALPATEAQAVEWQNANRSWWETHPMRYDFSKGVEVEEFSPEFYKEIDARFFGDAGEYLPAKQIPFDALIDFATLPSQDVLEIGVGMGSHAQLLAERARSYTGIDLTEYAVNSTNTRMRAFGLDKPSVRIARMDAEQMDLPDNSFDLIWSWGVIHHSSNTRRILEEMHRVLRPGGTAVTMVYHRNFWNYYIYSGLFGGVVKGNLFRSGSLHKVRQTEIDGALARFYTVDEWKQVVSEFFTVGDIRIMGSKTELIPLPGGSLKSAILGVVPNAAARFFTNTCGMGTFLVSTLVKPKG